VFEQLRLLLVIRPFIRSLNVLINYKNFFLACLELPQCFPRRRSRTKQLSFADNLSIVTKLLFIRMKETSFK